MKQVQSLDEMKMNIAKIISECKVYKKDISLSQYSIKTQHKNKRYENIGTDIMKSLDFDDCVKNIRNKARSLNSSKNILSPILTKASSHKLSLSVSQTDESPKKQNSFLKSVGSEKVRSSKQLPRLLIKYNKAHSPKNASSSQKYSLIKGQNNREQKPQIQQSYHSIMGEKRKAQQLRKMLIMGRIVKQNVIKEKKILINKKKQRRLQSLNFKQIKIQKTCLS